MAIKYSVNENVFDELTEEGAYWLGMLASDGSVHKKGNRVTLCLKASDREHIQKFIKFVEYSGLEKFRWATCKNKKYPNYYVSIGGKYIIKKLNTYGIVENKSNKDNSVYQLHILLHVPIHNYHSNSNHVHMSKPALLPLSCRMDYS